MQRNGIRWNCVFRERRMPSNLLCFRNQIQACSRQSGHVQRLADVASRLRPIGMVVEKRAARSKVEQRHAAQDGQRAPRIPMPEDRPVRVHTLTPFSVPAWTDEDPSWLHEVMLKSDPSESRSASLPTLRASEPGTNATTPQMGNIPKVAKASSRRFSGR